MSNTIYSDQIKVNCPLVHDESGYFHLIYQITNLVNGKVYVGKHSTKDPYDGYLGSGIGIGRAIKKYGIENFTKEILYCFDKETDAFLKEEELVTQEFVSRDDTYNMIVGGKGFKSGEENPTIKNRKHGKNKCGKNNPFYAKHHTQETRDRISKSHKGKHAGKKNPMYGMTGEKNPNYGKPRSQETKDKISKAQKGKTLSQETKNKISKSVKGKYTGANNPSAKPILKIDILGNVIIEYGCMKDCCEQEHINKNKLRKIIKEHIIYNCFYFEYKSNN